MHAGVVPAVPLPVPVWSVPATLSLAQLISDCVTMVLAAPVAAKPSKSRRFGRVRSPARPRGSIPWSIEKTRVAGGGCGVHLETREPPATLIAGGSMCDAELLERRPDPSGDCPPRQDGDVVRLAELTVEQVLAGEHERHAAPEVTRRREAQPRDAVVLTPEAAQPN